jgi:hypothetical protein
MATLGFTDRQLHTLARLLSDAEDDFIWRDDDRYADVIDDVIRLRTRVADEIDARRARAADNVAVLATPQTASGTSPYNDWDDRRRARQVAAFDRAISHATTSHADIAPMGNGADNVTTARQRGINDGLAYTSAHDPASVRQQYRMAADLADTSQHPLDVAYWDGYAVGTAF